MFDQRDQLKFLTKDEAATVAEYQKSQARVDALREAFASGDPGEQAAAMGLSARDAASLGPSGVSQLAQAFMHDQLVGKGNLAGKVMDLTQKASDRKDSRLALDALSPTPLVQEALTKAKEMGKSQADQEATFLRMKSDLAQAVLTNDPQVVLPKALEFMQAAKALDIARSSERLGTPTDPKLAEMRDQLGLPDDKILAGGIGPHEKLASSLLFGDGTHGGMLPSFVEGSDLRGLGQGGQGEQGIVTTPDRTFSLGPNNSITSKPGEAPLPDRGGPLAGGGYVDKSNPLSFTNANPGGAITQAQNPQVSEPPASSAAQGFMGPPAPPAEGPLASGPDLAAKGLSAVGDAGRYAGEAMAGYPAGRAILGAPSTLANVVGKVGEFGRSLAQNPTLQSMAQGIGMADQQIQGPPPTAPAAQPSSPDPRAFGLSYKAAHPAATAAEIRQAFYSAFPEMLRRLGSAVGPSEAGAAEIPGDQAPDQATINARMAKMGDLSGGGTPPPAAPVPDARRARLQQMIQQLQAEVSLMDPVAARQKLQQIQALKLQLAQ